MNSTHQTVNILKFCRFYYHLQVFKQSNLVNYQHKDSGSNRERITVEIHVFHYNSGGKKMQYPGLTITCGRDGNFLRVSHCAVAGYWGL